MSAMSRATCTGNGGLGVVSEGPQYDPRLGVPAWASHDAVPVTNMPEMGAFFSRDPAQLNNGVPNAIATMAAHSQSVVSLGSHIAVASLNPNALDVDLGSDDRWVPSIPDFTVSGPDGNGNYLAHWAPAVGSGNPILLLSPPAEETAYPTTGIEVDLTMPYWSRIGELILPAVVDDQNPGVLTPGPSPITTITIAMVVTPYENDWTFTDLLAFYDASATTESDALLATLRLDGDTLQLWIREQMIAESVLNPWAKSIDPSQQLQGRRPVIIIWSLDTSTISDTYQSGKGSLVAVDPYTKLGIDFTFWNRSTDPTLGTFLGFGMPGSPLYYSGNPFAADTDGIMRMDIFDVAYWGSALELDEMLNVASQLDSIYGIVQ